jgi:hypothetical protein
MGWYGPVGGLLDYSFVELMLGSRNNGQDMQLETQVVPYKCRGSDSWDNKNCGTRSSAVGQNNLCLQLMDIWSFTGIQ